MYKIIFQVNNDKRFVTFNKEFDGLAAVFEWADRFVSKHDWTNEYKIMHVKEKRRKNNAELSSRER